MKISAKLITGFLTIAFIAAIVGTVALVSIIGLSNSDKILYSENTVSLQYSGAAAGQISAAAVQYPKDNDNRQQIGNQQAVGTGEFRKREH
jgi:CHASE3 domain sensor protein